MRWLAVDGGQSELRVRASWLREDLQGEGYSHSDERVHALLRSIFEVVDRLDLGQGIDVIAVGHTGMPDVLSERVRAAEMLMKYTGAREVRLTADWVTCHLGALAGRPGVVIASGTGTVCLGRAADSRLQRVGGWGHLLGDDGSGFFIGRAGLRAALAAFDGRGPATSLVGHAEANLNQNLVLGIARLYESPSRVNDIAQFTRHVVDAARKGDHVAQTILHNAVNALVEHVVAAYGALFEEEPAEVSYTGGAFREKELLLDEFTRLIEARLPQAMLTPPEGTPLDGAVLLATTDIFPLRNLVHTARNPKS